MSRLTAVLALPLACALTCALPASAARAASQASAGPWALRFDGAGPLRIGMTFAQARAALGGHLTATPREQLASPNCDQIELMMPRGVMLMFQEGVLARVDEWGTHGGRTDKGVLVGDTEARVLALYPSARREPHAYDPDGAYLTVRDDKRHLWLRFETAHGHVTQFYAGTPDAVQATEGCL